MSHEYACINNEYSKMIYEYSKSSLIMNICNLFLNMNIHKCYILNIYNSFPNIHKCIANILKGIKNIHDEFKYLLFIYKYSKSIMNIQKCHDIFVTPQGAHPYSVLTPPGEP